MTIVRTALALVLLTSCTPRPEEPTVKTCVRSEPQLAFMCMGPAAPLGGIAVSPTCGYHLTVACVEWQDRPNPNYVKEAP